MIVTFELNILTIEKSKMIRILCNFVTLVELEYRLILRSVCVNYMQPAVSER